MPSNQKIVRKSFDKDVTPEELIHAAKETSLVAILRVEEGVRQNHYEIGYHEPENLIDFGIVAGIMIKQAKLLIQ